MTPRGSKYMYWAWNLVLATVGAWGTIRIVDVLGTDWFLNNPIDQRAGVPLYVSLPVAISVACTLALMKRRGWLACLISWTIALFAYIGIVLAWWGLHSTGAIGASFTSVAYLPLVGVTVAVTRLTPDGR